MTEKQTQPATPQRRSAYAPPRLVVYGDLRTLTLTSVTMNMNDMVSGRMT
jgi:hypothetical protein